MRSAHDKWQRDIKFKRNVKKREGSGGAGKFVCVGEEKREGGVKDRAEARESCKLGAIRSEGSRLVGCRNNDRSHGTNSHCPLKVAIREALCSARWRHKSGKAGIK